MSVAKLEMRSEKRQGISHIWIMRNNWFHSVGHIEGQENPAAVKAQIVKAIKSMQNSLQYGEQITNILAESRVWAEYKDQKHDLFIANTPIAGYLTGGGEFWIKPNKMMIEPMVR